MSLPTAVAARRPDVRRQVLVAAAVLAGVYLVVFGPGIVLALRTLVAGVGPAPPAGWQAQVAAVEWDVFTVAVVLAVVVRWLPRHAPVVTGRAVSRRSSASLGWAGAVAVFVAVATTSAWLGEQALALAHLTAGANTQVGDGMDGFAIGALASVSAGVTEEIALVALVVAVVSAAAGRARWATPATVAVLVVLRLLPHLYYGWGSVFVGFWTVGAYVLYRWVGTVWPLVIGHIVYDWLVLAAHTFPALSPIAEETLWGIAALGAVAAARAFLAGRPAARAVSDG